MRKQQERIRDLPIGLFDHFLEPGYTQLAKGTRPTPKRLERIIVGDIWPQEREILKAMLFNWEEALAWGFLKMGKVRPEVAPLMKIKIAYGGEEILLGVRCCMNIHSGWMLYLQI